MEEYWSNGQLSYRCHKTIDGRLHGFAESYNEDGSIEYLCYYNNGKLIKLLNYYNFYFDIINIKYYI